MKSFDISVYDIFVNGTEFRNFSSIYANLNEGRLHSRSKHLSGSRLHCEWKNNRSISVWENIVLLWNNFCFFAGKLKCDFLVYVFLLHGRLLRYFLAFATRAGFSNGEFVYITLDLFRNEILRADLLRRRERTFEMLCHKIVLEVFRRWIWRGCYPGRAISFRPILEGQHKLECP